MSWTVLMYSHTECVFILISHAPTKQTHHFPRPPTLPPKPQRMRKCRPRSIFNRKLFNGNMEAFIQVLAHLCSLSLHELSRLTSIPWEFSCLCPLFYPNVGSLTHWLSSRSLPCLHTVLQLKKKTGWGGKAIKQALEVDWFHTHSTVADLSFNILSPVSP